jgi:hypothetical protein
MSFEAAIDREYKRQREAAREANRQSFVPNGNALDQGTCIMMLIDMADTNAQDHTNGYESRRSSYWGMHNYS